MMELDSPIVEKRVLSHFHGGSPPTLEGHDMQVEVSAITFPKNEGEGHDNLPATFGDGVTHSCTDVSSLSSWDVEENSDFASTWATSAGDKEEDIDSILLLSSPPMYPHHKDEMIFMDSEEMAGIFDEVAEVRMVAPTAKSLIQPSAHLNFFGGDDNGFSMDEVESVPTIAYGQHRISFSEQMDMEDASELLSGEIQHKERKGKKPCCHLTSIATCLQQESDFIDSLDLQQTPKRQELHQIKSQIHKQKLFLQPQAQQQLRLPDLLAFSLLPEEMIYSITCFLDVKSLTHLRSVSTKINHLASADVAGWAELSQKLWTRKVTVCPEAQKMLLSSKERWPVGPPQFNDPYKGAMGAYKASVKDGNGRDEINLDELCNDLFNLGSGLFSKEAVKEQGPVWSFRFKESAGIDWTGWDPWWNGSVARRMVFLTDGRVMQLVEEKNDEDGHNRESSNLTTEYQQGVVRPQQLRPAFSDSADVLRRHPLAAKEYPVLLTMRPPNIDMKWCLVQRPLDQPARPYGAYMRLTVGGRDVPTYVVRRSPTKNWGFIMESCWGLFTNFDLPRRGAEEEDTAVQLSDNALKMNNESQWKEALMHNHGAEELPSGPTDRVVFNRTFENVGM